MVERPPLCTAAVRPLLPALPTTAMETIRPVPLCSYQLMKRCCKEDRESRPLPDHEGQDKKEWA